MQPELRQSERFDSHAGWRYRCLRKAGFGDAGARRVAEDRDFDLHSLLGLIDRGCPTELAVRIVAPLEPGPRSG